MDSHAEFADSASMGAVLMGVESKSCELHPTVRECGAHRTNGEPCHASAMHGQQVCYRHGGNSPQARAAAQERILGKADAAAKYLADVVEGTEDATPNVRVIAARDLLDRAGVREVDDDGQDIVIIVEWPE